ncbi:MAG: GNAT family N-acetyltransferase [Oscillospiraceae bacterium]|nr:GNAT family N-acetyltransferase [Oscillospiraceae bacterium]
MIETERLILRTFCEEDATDLYEYLKEPMVHCFACMQVNSLEEAKVAALDRAKNTEYYFAIVLKENGKVIGEIDAMPETAAPDEKNAVLDTFSPCWMLHPDYHGKGYALEAAKAFFDYLFCEKGARRIYAYTEDYNLASQKLCQKLGMRQEGLFREFVTFVNDENGDPIYENTMQWALLKKEWVAGRKRGKRCFD